MNGPKQTIPQFDQKAIVVIIDITSTGIILRNEINKFLNFSSNGNEYEKLFIQVRNSIIRAIFCCIHNDDSRRKEFGLYNENLHQAIDTLNFYGIPLELAASVVNLTETAFMKNMLDFFPYMDDVESFYIKQYKFLLDGNLAIMIELLND